MKMKKKVFVTLCIVLFLAGSSFSGFSVKCLRTSESLEKDSTYFPESFLNKVSWEFQELELVSTESSYDPYNPAIATDSYRVLAL
jgi:hypothetical protein